MNYWTWICPECGESVPIASQSCPKCGCPQPQTEVPASDSVVTAPNGSEPPQSKPVRHPQKTFSFRISAIVSLLLGLGIIAFGYKTMTTAPNVSAYSAFLIATIVHLTPNLVAIFIRTFMMPVIQW